MAFELAVHIAYFISVYSSILDSSIIRNLSMSCSSLEMNHELLSVYLYNSMGLLVPHVLTQQCNHDEIQALAHCHIVYRFMFTFGRLDFHSFISRGNYVNARIF